VTAHSGLKRLLGRFAAAICLAVCVGSGFAQAPAEPSGERADAPVTVPASQPAAAGETGATKSVRSGQTSRAPNSSAQSGLSDLTLSLPEAERRVGDTSSAVRIVLALTLLAILPSLVVCVTAFLRIVIVLSMLRHAIGMPETPPNTVVIGLALFLTLFTMNPVLQKVNTEALQPFMAGKISTQQGLDSAIKPLREFMVKQTREQDLALMVEISKSKRPTSMDDISNLQLIPAFMLSELRAAFQIGFVIFLPFLLIDLIVSSILMSLGMMMMPPITIALPIKILMFVLVDGWSLIVKALVGSFH
jgi:flagellar biosynthetic protein FliP